MAGQREQQRNRVLGGGERIAVGGVHHRDALGGGGIDIDGVDAGAGAADDFQLFRAFDGLSRDQRGRTHEHGIDAFEGGGEFGGVFDRIGNFDGPTGVAKHRQAVFVDSIACQHFHQSAP